MNDFASLFLFKPNNLLFSFALMECNEVYYNQICYGKTFESINYTNIISFNLNSKHLYLLEYKIIDNPYRNHKFL